MLSILADAGSSFYISSLAVIEIQSVFSQKVRDGKIDEADYLLTEKRTAADIQSEKLIVRNLLRPHQRMAEKLLEKREATATGQLDALQLGAAMELTKKLTWTISSVPTSIWSTSHGWKGFPSSIPMNP